MFKINYGISNNELILEDNTLYIISCKGLDDYLDMCGKLLNTHSWVSGHGSSSELYDKYKRMKKDTLFICINPRITNKPIDQRHENGKIANAWIEGKEYELITDVIELTYDQIMNSKIIRRK